MKQKKRKTLLNRKECKFGIHPADQLSIQTAKGIRGEFVGWSIKCLRCGYTWLDKSPGVYPSVYLTVRDLQQDAAALAEVP
jgi:hypothetical protein